MIRDAHYHYHIQGIGLEETVKFFSDFMNSNDIEAITYLSLHHWMEPEDDTILANLIGLWLKDVMYPRVYSYMSLWHNYDERDTAEGYLEQLRRNLDMGCEGVKSLDGKPDLRKRLKRRLDDPIFDLFYTELEERQIPIVMHARDPQDEWYVGTEDHITTEGLYDEVISILKKHPKLHLILAHFFFLGDNLEKASELFEEFPNLALDITPGTEMYIGFSNCPEKSKEFFIKYSNRIYFGTDFENHDCPLWRQGNYDLATQFLIGTEPFTSMHGIDVNPLGLDEEIAERILRGNHIKLNGELPKKNNYEAIRNEIERIESLDYQMSEREKKEFKIIKDFYLNK